MLADDKSYAIPFGLRIVSLSISAIRAIIQSTDLQPPFHEWQLRTDDANTEASEQKNTPTTIKIVFAPLLTMKNRLISRK